MKRDNQYANPREFRYYAQGLPAEAIAKKLRCTPATARRWLAADGGIPWWAPMVLKAEFMEGQERARQMGYLTSRLAVVTGNVYAFPARQQIDRTSANRIAALSLALAAEPGTMLA